MKRRIAIFLFGNKRNSSGTIELANGVREEFEIALALGTRCVVAGATGYTAAKLAMLLPPDPDRTTQFNKALTAANDPATKPDGVLKAILTMVDELRAS